MHKYKIGSPALTTHPNETVKPTISGIFVLPLAPKNSEQYAKRVACGPLTLI